MISPTRPRITPSGLTCARAAAAEEGEGDVARGAARRGEEGGGGHAGVRRGGAENAQAQKKAARAHHDVSDVHFDRMLLRE
jgi:spore coat protein CotH